MSFPKKSSEIKTILQKFIKLIENHYFMFESLDNAIYIHKTSIARIIKYNAEGLLINEELNDQIPKDVVQYCQQNKQKLFEIINDITAIYEFQLESILSGMVTYFDTDINDVVENDCSGYITDEKYKTLVQKYLPISHCGYDSDDDYDYY